MPDTVNVLFWNTNRRNRTDLVVRLVQEYGIDIVLLAEHDAVPHEVEASLRSRVNPEFCNPEPESFVGRIQVFAGNPGFDLREVYADPGRRLTVRTLKLQNEELLLAVVHLPSRREWSNEGLSLQLAVYADQIRSQEDAHSHRRTFLCGDFNMNPFESGMVAANGFHAVMTKQIAKSGGRTVLGSRYPFFYNPMWGLFGDRPSGPPGSYYKRLSEQVSFDWNILDQVLIRPEALRWFSGRVEFLTQVGKLSLATRNGRPDRNIGSDHFPLMFQLAIPKTRN